MTQVELLNALKQLTATERLALVEAALHLIREDLQHIESPQTHAGRKQQLAAAAEARCSPANTLRKERSQPYDWV